MNWDEVKRVYYYRKMADGKLHFFVRETREAMRVRELGWTANAESSEKMDELLAQLNAEDDERL